MNSRLISMGACPFCKKGTNTPCFAEFTNGYHCYSCGRHKHVSDKAYAFKTTKLTKETNYPKSTSNIAQFSINVLQWLYKYYVFEQLIRKYQISYCKEREDSLVFSVIKDSKVVFWQQRFFPSKKFKTGGEKSEIFYIKHQTSKKLVLVEDYISAIRVGEFANTICLWGVHVNKDVSKFIKNIDISEIIIWLDPDNAGEQASEIIYKTLTKEIEYQNKKYAFSTSKQRSVMIKNTKKQPKEYTDSELKTLLE